LIDEQTSDIEVSLVFNNAGYMVMDGFAHMDASAKLGNLECNATSVVRITDHFYRKMLKKNIRGAFFFTASCVAFTPTPFATIYSATKAFVSLFASSLSLEAAEHGIDVLAVHPGLVRTAFYDTVPKLFVFRLLNLVGQSPDQIARVFFADIGRTISRDTGGFAYLSHLAEKIVGANFLIPLMRAVAHRMPDLVRFRKYV